MLNYLSPLILRSILPRFEHECKCFDITDWTLDGWAEIGDIYQAVYIDDESGVVCYSWEDPDVNFDNPTEDLSQIIHPVAVCDEWQFHSVYEINQRVRATRIFCEAGDQWLVLWGNIDSPVAMAWKVDPSSHVDGLYFEVPTFSDLLVG